MDSTKTTTMMGKPIPALCSARIVQQAEVDDMNRAKAAVYTFLAAHRRVRKNGMRENPLFLISLDIVRSIGRMVLSEVWNFYRTVMNPEAVYLFFGMFLPGNEQWIGYSVSPLFSPGFHACDENGSRICFVGYVKIRAGATDLEIEEELRAQFSLIDSGLQCCIGMPRLSTDGAVIDFTTDDWEYVEWGAGGIAHTIRWLSDEWVDMDDESSDIAEGYNAIDMFWVRQTFELPQLPQLPHGPKRHKTSPLTGQTTLAEDQVDGSSGDEE